MNITLPLIRSTRIDRVWRKKDTEVTLPASQMRLLTLGNAPKVDPEKFAEAVAKKSKDAPAPKTPAKA